MMIEEAKLKYRYQKQNELYEDIQGFKKVYLDLNYWIWLGKVHSGRNNNLKHVRLYDIFRKLLEAKTIICPISPLVFDELLKQAGQPEFEELIIFIEIMSKNVITVTEQEIVYLEFKEIFTSYLIQKNRNDICNLFWTRPIDILGHKIHRTNVFQENENKELEIYKKYLDFSWKQTLIKVVKLSGIGLKRLNKDYKQIETISSLNDGNIIHNDEIGSFDELYETERLGTLDFYKIIAWRAFEETLLLHNLKFKNKIIIFERLMLKVVDVKCQIPGIIEVMAGIHALVRYENRKYIDFNDMYDYHHSFYSVPYFDYFFTERKLCNLVNHPRLKLGLKYNCHIEHDIDETIRCLEKLLPTPP